MPTGPNDESPLAFLRRVGEALLRVVALAVFGLVHWLLEKGIGIIVPPNLASANLLLLDISFAAFACIYIYLLWDMITVFIPALQAAKYPVSEADKNAE